MQPPGGRDSALQLVVLLALLGPALLTLVEGQDYWQLRAQMLNDEQSRSIGARMNLSSPEERAANRALVQAKRAEIEQGERDPSKFLPKQNFLTVGPRLAKSRVFRMIEAMPKGAVLHAHDTGIVSWEWVYWNVTYRAQLYACVTPSLERGELQDDDPLKLHFFAAQPRHERDGQCQWRLLRELRANDTRRPRAIDLAILRRLTMMVPRPEQAYPDSDAAWRKFQGIFAFITPMLAYRPVYEDHFYRALSEFYNDNVLYVELRTTLPQLYELDGTQYGPLDVARIYKKVTDRFTRDHPDFVGVKLIYAPLRSCSLRELDEFADHARQLKQALPDFVAGFDLVGQEDKGQPLKEFAERLRSLGRDVQLFFHAGETNWYGSSVDDNLIDAVLLNAKRIGHGYALLKHPRVMQLVKERGIAIEVCPISNQVLSLVEDLRNHPASHLFAEDYPVVVSNDDPGLWGALGLSYDFYEAFVGIMSSRADLRALKQLALNSIEYSSMSDEQRRRALAIWHKRWRQFVARLADPGPFEF